MKSNLPAQRMYEKAGFSFRGVQRLYAENTGMTDFLYYEESHLKSEHKDEKG